MYQSEAATNQRNEGIANLLQSYDRIYFDPIQATDVYTKQCSLNVTVKDLAAMAATLANGGVNPLTMERIMRLLAELHCDSLYPMMGKDAWVAGADRREAPGPKPVRLGRRLRLRRQPPGSCQLWNGGVQRGVSVLLMPSTASTSWPSW